MKNNNTYCSEFTTLYFTNNLINPTSIDNYKIYQQINSAVAQHIDHNIAITI